MRIVRWVGWVGLVVAVLAMASVAPATAAPSRKNSLGGARITEVQAAKGPEFVVSHDSGRAVFFNETFAGNGRTCATCHLPAAQFTISPADVEASFQADPFGPLFRDLDSDGGAGRSFSIVRQHALFKVKLELHPGIWLADDPGQRCITLRRAVPSIANVGLTAPYQLDGRLPNLPAQAQGAVNDHFEAGRPPLQEELLALARFQSAFFSPLRLEALVENPAAAGSGFSEPAQGGAARRGRDEFEFFCASCHGGELRSTPPDPSASIFQRVFISELNNAALPLQRFIFLDPATAGQAAFQVRAEPGSDDREDGCRTIIIPPFTGAEEVFSTPDPGRAAVSGRAEDLNAFKVRSLRGVSHTAPYFHDNSAATLDEVIEHYNRTFGFDITARRRDDLLTFLNSL